MTEAGLLRPSGAALFIKQQQSVSEVVKAAIVGEGQGLMSSNRRAPEIQPRLMTGGPIRQ